MDRVGAGPAVWIEWGQGGSVDRVGAGLAVWIEWEQGRQCGSSGSRAGSVDRVGAGPGSGSQADAFLRELALLSAD